MCGEIKYTLKNAIKIVFRGFSSWSWSAELFKEDFLEFDVRDLI
jgi:hypothetical protein